MKKIILKLILFLVSLTVYAVDPEPIKIPFTDFKLEPFRQKVITVGHDSPDPDAVFSALGLAEYLIQEQKYLDMTGRIPKPNIIFEASIVDNLPPQAEFIYQIAGFPIMNGPLKRVPKTFDGKIPDNIKFFILDHNDPTQSIPYLKKPENLDNLEGIIDHHVVTQFGGEAMQRLNQKNKDNKYYRSKIEILGSSCTHVTKLFFDFENKYKKNIISVPIAKALWGGIIADTTNFTSDATKPLDKEMANWLINKGSIQNPSDLINKILEVKYDLKNLSAEQIVFLDFKQLPLANITSDPNAYVFFGLSEVNDKYFGALLARSEELLRQIRESRKEWVNVKGFFFGIANMDKKETYLFLPSEKEREFALKNFKVDGQTVNTFYDKERNIMILKGYSSRKSHFAKPIQEANWQ